MVVLVICGVGGYVGSGFGGEGCSNVVYSVGGELSSWKKGGGSGGLVCRMCPVHVEASP